MISFNNLGNLGRLGNQMFQYAALRGIASHKGYWYSFPSSNELFDCFKLNTTLPNSNTNIISTDKFEFDENFFNNCPDDVDVYGFFQSEKYFKNIENEIRNDFVFKDKIYNRCKFYADEIFSEDIISLHVRRTDYITDKNFEVLDMNYYRNSLEFFDSDTPVIVFSDDPEWCKNHFKEKRFIISQTRNSNMDLCLMSLCKNHIIANSSFSWWGSWLANSKKTIAPKKWFRGDFSHWNTHDLYLPHWVTI